MEKAKGKGEERDYQQKNGGENNKKNSAKTKNSHEKSMASQNKIE